MKKNLLLGTLMILGLSLTVQNAAFAKVFSVEKTTTVNKRIKEIKDVIMDTDHTCDKGCKYKLTNVRELKTVEVEDENHVYTWCYIDATKDSKFYSLVEVKEDEDRKVTTIRTTYPSKEKTQELKDRYGLPTKLIFNSVDSVWTLKENFDQAGNFLNTTVTYSNTVETTSMLLRFFSGAVSSGIETTARDQIRNVQL